MEWISIKDRMPDRDDRYLIHVRTADLEKPFITVAWYDPETGEWSMIAQYWVPSITHWMIVPGPPEV